MSPHEASDQYLREWKRNRRAGVRPKPAGAARRVRRPVVPVSCPVGSGRPEKPPNCREKPCRGLTWHRSYGVWELKIKYKGHSTHLGYWPPSMAGDAARAWDRAAWGVWGKLEILNFPLDLVIQFRGMDAAHRWRKSFDLGVYSRGLILESRKLRVPVRLPYPPRPPDRLERPVGVFAMADALDRGLVCTPEGYVEPIDPEVLAYRERRRARGERKLRRSMEKMALDGEETEREDGEGDGLPGDI